MSSDLADRDFQNGDEGGLRALGGSERFEIRTYASVEEIADEQWQSLWPLRAEGRDFYRCQEFADIQGFHFFYLGISDGGRLVLVAPLFTARFNMGLAMDDAGRERLAQVQTYWPGLLVFKTLFCGSPTSEKGIVAVHPAYRQDASLFLALDRALLTLAKKHGAWMVVFKDLAKEDLETLTPMRSRGWFVGESLPTAKLDLADTPSVDSYLCQLRTGMSKYLRRKLKKHERNGLLRIEATNDIGHCVDEIYRLYRCVYDNGPMHFELLTPEFFLNFCRHMPERTIYFLYWLQQGTERRLVGMNFCLHFDDRLIDKYIGMDYSVSRNLDLYFISFLNNLRWCIEQGKRTYMLSQGGYPVKLQLGATLIPLFTMTRIVNPFVNWFATRFSRGNL